MWYLDDLRIRDSCTQLNIIIVADDEKSDISYNELFL